MAQCVQCDVARSRPAARVAVTDQAAAAADADGDDEYEDVEEDFDNRSDSATQPSLTSLDSQAVTADGASCNLSMIMEQSYMDADFNLCLSGMHCHSYFVII